jgi:hypothetical protein
MLILIKMVLVDPITNVNDLQLQIAELQEQITKTTDKPKSKYELYQENKKVRKDKQTFTNEKIFRVCLLISIWFVNFYIADEIRKQYNASANPSKFAFSRYTSIIWMFVIPFMGFLSFQLNDYKIAYGTVGVYLFGIMILSNNNFVKKLTQILDV